MTPGRFVKELGRLEFENTFNPYSSRCKVHDFRDAPYLRSEILRVMLESAADSKVDSIWIGRDLGYRGGRRTGLALTDDVHFNAHANRWGVTVDRPTKGKAVKERTAAVIWSILSRIDAPIFLWNVFPLHPHKRNEPFSNRSHNSCERKAGEDVLCQLLGLLRPQRLVAIGNDAAHTAYRLASDQQVLKVRHPSYGGQSEFLAQINALYVISEIES